MADKKRKIFISKESSTPRRPVILKSDREATKEQLKEKQEKEKQPTIILKTREQSTPKEERPLSPKLLKVQTTDHDGPHPCKIAQNENKEKKVAEPKPLHPLKTMTQPLKLLDENLEFCQSALEYLQDSSTSYLVVGVIGTQGVGKSLILNLIAHNSSSINLCSHLLKSHDVNERFEIEYQGGVDTELEKLNIVDTPEVKTQEDSSHNSFKFKMQDMEQIERGVHCTKGIDMYVTNDRVILLDCQALWSPSLIEETNLNPITSRSANLMTVDCLQIASFLMAVCHVVIAVQDWFANYNFIRYIQTAEMLMPSLSASNSSTSAEGSESTNTGENHPHLLLLHNRCQLEDFTPDTVRIMQDFYRKAFQKSNLQLSSGMYMYTDTNKNGVGVDGSRRQYNVERCGAPINMFLLPEINDDQQEMYRGHPPFEECARRLRWLVLGVSRHNVTNVANLSERGWFAYCAKAWEIIRKSTFYMEYERFLP